MKVRRTPNRSKTSPSRPRLDNTITFSPGSVGLELEPLKEDPKYGCRVVRFVDGGPKRPGQARESGKIKPGDLVHGVEGNGIVASSYDDIIKLLKDISITRTIRFRSVWGSSFLDEQSKLNLHDQHVESEIQKAPTTTNVKNFSSSDVDNMEQSPTLPHSGFPMDITLIHSPSQAALLPHVLEETSILSSRLEGKGTDSFGPIIIPLDVSTNSAGLKMLPVEPRTPTRSNIMTPDLKLRRETSYQLQSGSNRDGDTASTALTPRTNMMEPEENFEITFSPSSVKKISLQGQAENLGQTTLSRVFETMYRSVGPAVTSSSSAIGFVVANKIAPVSSLGTKVANKIEEAISTRSFQDVEKVSQLKSKLLQELNSTKIAINAQDIVRKGFMQNMDDLAPENVSLRAEFQEKLYAAKIQHVSD